MNFANAAQTTLASPCGLADTTITVVSAIRFPAAPFHIVVDTELMTVTAVLGSVFTVTRGIEGTGSQNHATGATVTCTVTAGDFAGFGTGGGGGDMIAPAINAETTTNNVGINLIYDTWVNVVAFTNDVTVTLPAPALSSGKPQYVAIRSDPTSVHPVFIASHAGETIDGLATRILFAKEAYVLKTDGVNWNTVACHKEPQFAGMLLGTDQAFALNTYTQVALDTQISDSNGHQVDLVNHRINIVRDGMYAIQGQISYDYAPAASWGTTSGARVLILNNAAPGGATWAASSGQVLAGSFANITPSCVGLVPLLRGAFIALEGYMGGDSGNFNQSNGVPTSLSMLESPI